MTGTIHKKVQKFKAKKMRIGGDRGKKRKKERRNVDFIYCVICHVTKFIFSMCNVQSGLLAKPTKY